MTLRDTIKTISREHVEKHNGLIIGQCLSAVGWVDGTVPDCKGIVELPMTDVAGAGFAVGAAIAGRRPILVLRFQDFMLLNGTPLINVAAKRDYIFGEPAPVFVRAIAREGGGAGMSHSGKLHAMVCHFPGVRVWAPVTPGEWRACYDDYMVHNDPMFCCEHRGTYDNESPWQDKIQAGARVALFAIGSTRQNVEFAANLLEHDGIKVNIVAIYKLKPFCAMDVCKTALGNFMSLGDSKGPVGLVVDNGYEMCGYGRDLAYRIMTECHDSYVEAMGLQDVPVGVAEQYENAPPSVVDIVKRAKEMLGAI